MSFFNPLDKFYKNIPGAVCENQKMKFRVKGNFGSVILLVKKDGCNDYSPFYMEQKFVENGEKVFEVEFSLPVGLYFYHFDCGTVLLGLGEDYTAKTMDLPSDFQLTVYSHDYKVSNLLNGGVMYQIFPDRFCSSGRKFDFPNNKVKHSSWNEIPYFLPNSKGQVLNNDFFCGDLQGIISKLDYLVQLGVTCVYLNPIFKAYSNHRYDTGDYMQIDPILGNIDDFKQLIEECSERNISIVLDGVFNHTGADSKYFNKYGKYDSIGAYQSKDSPYYDWFNFGKYPECYESWWGIDTLPSVNESSESYIDYITGENGVIDTYTKLGIGGWRLDVVDELPAQFVRKIRNAVKRVNDNAVIIGEVWEDASNKIAYSVRREYFQGKELDSVMNYPLKNAIISFVKSGNSTQLSNVIKTQLDHYPHAVIHTLMNMLSTHDTFRIVSALADTDIYGKSKLELSKIKIEGEELEKAKFLQKTASLLQFTLYGVPCIYYGDEICMQGYSDPLCRLPFSWDNMDADMLKWYKKLGEIRNSNSVFADGELIEVLCEEGVYAFKRVNDTGEVLVIVNISDTQLKLEFKGEIIDLIEGKNYIDNVVVKPNQLCLFKSE